MSAGVGVKFQLLLVELALMAPVLAHAVRPPSNYACLAKDADNIAIVRASSIEPRKVYADYFGVDYYLLQLGIEEQIYLLPAQGKHEVIELLSRRPGGGYVEDAEFKPGISYLVFLRSNENGPYVLHGSQGALPFDNGKVGIHGRKLSRDQVRVFVSKAQALDIQCEWH